MANQTRKRAVKRIHNGRRPRGFTFAHMHDLVMGALWYAEGREQPLGTKSLPNLLFFSYCGPLSRFADCFSAEHTADVATIKW
jgi:hypothetical protein